MTCYKPLTAFYSKEFGASGKRLITFNKLQSFSGVPLKLPCGQCVGCRLDHSLQWGVRCMHEKQLHTESCFLTLTFDPKCRPLSLSVLEHQLFMKRFRKKFGEGIRFFMCGEYTPENNYPHYHYLMFNRDMPDRKFFKKSKAGSDLYRSEVLEGLWPFGFSTVGDVTLESCCYVARYIVDKITGERAADHYGSRKPEFTCQSRRPGLASEWYNKYGRHSHFSGDFAVLNGKRVRMPRFYDGRFELSEPDALEDLKRRRRRNALRHRANNTIDRLRVREVVSLRKLALFKREFK